MEGKKLIVHYDGPQDDYLKKPVIKALTDSGFDYVDSCVSDRAKFTNLCFRATKLLTDS